MLAVRSSRLISLDAPTTLASEALLSALLLLGTPALWVVVRAFVRRTQRSRTAETWTTNSLLIVSAILSVGAVVVGELHVAGIRNLLRELAVLQPGDGAIPGIKLQVVESYRLLAIAGGLLQLAVVSLGGALHRRAISR
ncbi:MAG: hypothetical protein JXQ73_09520 [Phycisphaerae bacterium]|nr:hypothetical protein [Phycisphaerae bacterium]